MVKNVLNLNVTALIVSTGRGRVKCFIWQIHVQRCVWML